MIHKIFNMEINNLLLFPYYRNCFTYLSIISRQKHAFPYILEKNSNIFVTFIFGVHNKNTSVFF